MYPIEPFKLRCEEAWAVLAKRGFGNLVLLSQENGFLCSHIPYLCCEQNGNRTVEFHLAKANPMVDPLSDGANCLLVCQAGDAYVRPDWYGLNDQVPTWIYIAAEARGRSRELPLEETQAHLDRLTKHFEAEGDTSFSLDQLPANKAMAMQQAIRCFSLDITAVSGHQKLSQHKPRAACASMLRALQAEAAPLALPLLPEIKKFVQEN